MKKIRIATILAVVFLCWMVIAWRVLSFSATTNASGFADKTSGSSLDYTYTANGSAGQLLVFALANDNTSTTDGDNGDVTGITDAAGNTYTEAAQFTNGQNNANAGATVSIWYSILTSNITANTTTFTLSFNASITAKAFSYRFFTIGSGNSVRVAGSATLANDGADAGSLALSGLTSDEYLYVRATAVEANTSTGGVTSGWTQLYFTQGSTGGGSASNMWLQVEYKIATSTGETSDPTTGSVDNASVIVALDEYTVTARPRRLNHLL